MKTTKHSFKRYLAYLLAFALVMSNISVTAYAEGTTSVPDDEVNITQEETFSDSENDASSDFGILEDENADSSGVEIFDEENEDSSEEQSLEDELIEDNPMEMVSDAQESDISDAASENEDAGFDDADFFMEDENADESLAEEEAEAEPVAFDQSQTVNNMVVTVKADPGVFPADAALSVELVPVRQQEQADAAVEEVRGEDQKVAVSYTFDIKVFDPETGIEYQPAEGQNVSVTFALAEVADTNLETSVYHVTEDESTGELSAEALDVTLEDEVTAVVETDGFSIYTVEFTYNTLEYVLSGDSSVALSEILQAVGLTGEVTDVTVSDDSLFSASNETGEWIVSAHQAFDTTEWMNVTINGIHYQITVTDDQQITSWSGLQAALSAGGTVTLTQDITAASSDSYLSVPKGVTVILDLAGYTIDRGLADQAAVDDGFVIKNEGTLTITDSSAAQTGTITGANNTDSGGAIINKGVLTVSGGTISGNRAQEAGAVLNAAGSVLTISGGTFENNTASTFGGGAIVNHGTVSMSGGLIQNNTAVKNGGGIWSDGTLTVTNGSFANNTAQADGGAVYITGDGSVSEISGGTITGNTADQSAGAVYMIGGTTTISGGTITGNTAKAHGGALYVAGNSTVLNLFGGTITGNTAADQGGAIVKYQDANTINIQGSPVILNNQAAAGPDIYMRYNSGLLNVTGALSADARIGVTLASGAGPVTFNYGTYNGPDRLACFVPGSSAYAVGADISQEIVLGSPVTVSFDPGPGTGSMQSVQVANNSYYPLPDCGFTPPHHQEFESWTVNGSSYFQGMYVTISGDTVVKAEYVKHSSYTRVEAVAPTETVNGSKEYYICDVCGGYYLYDGSTYKEISASDIVLPYFTVHDNGTYVRVICYNGADPEITIPDTVPDNYPDETLRGRAITSVNQSAFANNTVITKVVMGDNIQHIGWHAFYNASNLREVEVGAGLLYLDASIINCPALVSFTCTTTEGYLYKFEPYIYVSNAVFDLDVSNITFYGMHSGAFRNTVSTSSFAASGTRRFVGLDAHNAPTWTWATDFGSAEATFNCSECDFAETLPATVTSEITTQPTQTVPGVRTYTASVTITGVTYTDSKTEVIPVLPYTVMIADNIPYGTATADREGAYPGETVTLTAVPDENCRFKAWNVTDGNNAPVTVKGDSFLMPASHVTVSAVFEKLYAVNVTGGTADKDLAAEGESVTITANTPETGMRFKGWTGADSLTFTGGSSAVSSTATFTMPAQAVAVTATYEAIYAVNVTGGTANKNVAAEDESVTVTANTPETGMRFKEWTGADSLTFTGGSSAASSTATFTMPGRAVTLAATYETSPTTIVTVEFGEGHGDFAAARFGSVEGFTVTGTTLTYSVVLDSTIGDAKEVFSSKADFYPPAVDDGELFTDDLALNPAGYYASLAEVNAERSAWDGQPVPVEGLKFYAQWEKPVGAVTVSVTAPDPGTEVTVSGNEPMRRTDPQVSVSVTGNVTLDTASGANWWTDYDGTYYSGTVASGQACYARFYLNASYGYYLMYDGAQGPVVADGVSVTVENDSEANISIQSSYIRICAKVIAGQHAVSVANGTADKALAIEGESVTITANAPEAGMRFKEWTGADGLSFTSGGPTDAEATFTMPAQAVAVTATYEPAAPEFKSKSLILSGQIGVNFFMKLPEIEGVDYSNSYMTFSITGKGTTTARDNYDATFKDKSGNGYYGFTCFVNSIQMADTITATFHYGDDQTVSLDYSVADYIAYFDDHQNEYNQTTLDLIKAIADYGHYAQPFLSAENGWTIGTDYAEMARYYTDSFDLDSIKTAVQDYAFVKTIEGSGITKATYRLNLESETMVDVFLTVEDGTELTASATFNGKTFTAVKQADGRYRIRVSGISAHQMGDPITITGTAGSDFTITVSVLAYARAVLNSEAFNANAKNTMAALYQYYTAVKEYMGS